MAKHRKKRVGRAAMGVAAVGVATSVVGVAATQPASISASPVDLAALIVVGSSTNPSGAGVENFFNGKFNNPIYTGETEDDIVYVNFLTGPLGIKQALEANAGEQNAIIASGWGAANLSLLLLLDDPDLSQTVVVLDNDVARADGGFGTRYPWFSLIGVNPFPTPNDSPALAAVNTGYEYDYNSNAPADVFNPFAAVNALAGYLTTRLNQSELELPVKPDGTPEVECDANTCAITEGGLTLDCPDARCSSPADRITAYVTVRGGTTYVTYTSDGLPLANLMRDFLPFGDRIADLTEPLLTLLVNSAYYDGNPIPRDPSAYRPARLLPSPGELIATAMKIPGAIAEGLAAARSGSSSTSTSDENTELLASDEDSAESKKPKLNVVRDSDKAEPGKLDVEPANTTTDPEAVDPTDNSSEEETPEPPQADDADTDDEAGEPDDSPAPSADGEGAES